VDINSAYSFLLEHTHILTILAAYLITWRSSLKGGFLIDDDAGIQAFSESFRPESKDAKGNVIPEEKITSYGEGDKVYKFLDYLPHLGFPGCFMRWHRLHIGKKFTQIGKNSKGHSIYGFVQDPERHHLWSLICYGICLILGHNFLKTAFGEAIAFPAMILMAVHPAISQVVAWISGINYIYCLTFLFANYNILYLDLSYYWTIPLTFFFTLCSTLSILVGCFNFVILWLLGFHVEAIFALIAGLIVMFRDGKTAVNYRREEFKKQNMTNSITPNIRKPIVMLKTLWYYICLVVFPNKLGLYHEFGYHYSRKDEEPSFMFWAGLVSLSLMGYAFYSGDLLTRFCVVWFLSFFALFSNFLTANQFVVERYIFVPLLAYCIFFGRLLYPYPELLWLFIGLYAMRSISHLWTFRDHITFYQSNIQNFPKSEVAYGNLGVSYQAKGRSGTAFDLWMTATEINPNYDVPWYNMHSLLKSSGNIEQSREYLKKCMNAEVVHFKGTWEREMAQLDGAIMKKQALEAINKEMNDAINSGNTAIIPELKKKMEFLMLPTTVVATEPVKAPS